MADKDPIDGFNGGSNSFVFSIAFNADFTSESLETFSQSLTLTRKRLDDWDSLMGFRIIGETGSIRLYKIDNAGQYVIQGVALDAEAKEAVKALYDDCLKTIYAAGGKINPPVPHINRPPAPPKL